MKVRLIKKLTIEQYCLDNPKSRNAFQNWLGLLKNADWNHPGDILKVYASADLLGNGSSRIIFNLAGNHYRMICKYHFGSAMVHIYVKWIGTHAEYNALCAVKKQYTIDDY